MNIMILMPDFAKPPLDILCGDPKTEIFHRRTTRRAWVARHECMYVYIYIIIIIIIYIYYYIYIVHDCGISMYFIQFIIPHALSMSSFIDPMQGTHNSMCHWDCGLKALLIFFLEALPKEKWILIWNTCFSIYQYWFIY